jgi:hypothetical protein
MGTVFGIQLTPEIFPIFFIGMWLFVTSLLGLLSGWYKVMMEFPDTKDCGDLLNSYVGQSGSMGAWVSMSRILTLEVRKKGLRLRVIRLFGPFNRAIFIPWAEITAVRKAGPLWNSTILSFGSGGILSRLKIGSDLADRLWRDAGNDWPERGPIPEPMSRSSVGRMIFMQWLGITAFAAAFFIIVPRIVGHLHPEQIRDSEFPPIAVAVLFPGVVFGIVSLVRYFIRTRGSKNKT